LEDASSGADSSSSSDEFEPLDEVSSLMLDGSDDDDDDEIEMLSSLSESIDGSCLLSMAAAAVASDP
jgi:hypothetical protein